MDPLTALAAPGLLGGAIVALSLWLAHRRARASVLAVPRQDRGILVDAINIAHIPVDGIGGLGLVAGAVLVAWLLPAVGLSLAIAVTAGCAIAAGLILFRSRGQYVKK
jgi:hypothetical protein